MTPRIAVVGLGWMGTDHARVLAEHSDAELVAVVDRDAARGTALAERLGAVYSPDLAAVLGDVDAVSVCTPDAAHEQLALMALEAGRRVLVEKPLATSTDAIRRLLAAAGSDESRITVGHLLQHDSRVVRARHALANDGLGSIWHMRVRRHASRAVAAHVAGGSSVGWFGTIHDADLLLSFMPSDATQVRATGRRGLVSDQWDLIDATVDFADGTYGSLHESWTLATTRPNRSDSGFTVVAEGGSIDVDLGHGQVLVSGPESAVAPDVMHYPSAELRDASDLQTELDAWVQTLRTGEQHGVSGRQAGRAVSLVEAIHVSLESGSPATPVPIS